jgi:membrane-bound lytic murein transglycosylase D
LWLLTIAIFFSGCQNLAFRNQNSASNEVVAAEPTASDPSRSSKPKVLAEPLESSSSILTKRAAEPVTNTRNNDLLAWMQSSLRLTESDDAAVQRQLEWYVAHPEYLSRVFGRAERYLYHIVEALEEREMPVDLALLPVVESAFDPFAYSHGRAAGLWQIIPGTARHLGLTQNWWYDGRRDVIDSTRAALDYLERLYRLFDGDWLLAIAAYNAGEGNVTRAIARAISAGQPTDFWHLRPFLPVETRSYVPRLLAIKTLVADPAALGILLPMLANEPYFEIVNTGGQIDMARAADLAGLTTDQLYVLNPGVNRWATNPEGPHRLLVPVDQAARFSTALADLGERDRVQWSRHEVRNGETLGQLAERYRTTAAVLREVNELSGNLIRAGQALMIPHAVNSLSDYTQSVDARVERQQNREREGQRQLHAVHSGESLWSISQLYQVGVRELAVWNAMAPGDTLSVGRELVVWSDEPSVVRTQVVRVQNEQIRRINYVVRSGDSLSRISTRFRVSVTDLVQWNELDADALLQPGQRLMLYVDVTEQSS